MQKVLDITKIQTVEDLNSVNFDEYTDTEQHPSWVRYINDPVSQKDLDRICDLSEEVGSNVQLGCSMGELYYKVRPLPQIKVLEQTPLFDNKLFSPQ